MRVPDLAQKALSLNKGSAPVALIGIFAILVWTLVAAWAASRGWLVAWAANALSYMMWLLNIGLAICAFILVPLSLFRTTRQMSRRGFLMASYLFGGITWVLAVVATHYHLGLFWTLIGLAVLFVGVVPLGVLGTVASSDWTATGVLVGGVALTFATRAAALWLRSRIDGNSL
jgi:hypothetical protein